MRTSKSCPKCHVSIAADATSCDCGWVKARPPESPNARPLGYRQCEWTSDHQRCRYPGSMSSNTHEGGPWYCSLHFACESAAYGASIVEASRDYQHPTPAELDAAHRAEVSARLKARGLDRQPNETVKQWMKRTSEWMRGKGTKTFKDAA